MSGLFLETKYNRNDFVSFLSQKFLPIDFEQSQTKIVIDKTDSRIKNAIKLGFCPSLELNIYEFKHNSRYDPRVTLSRESFNIIKNDEPNALAVFFNEDNAQWRLSLITSDYSLGKKKGHVKQEFSNPRRFSYLLGENCKLHTPQSMLDKDYRVKSYEDLVSRFAIEVVTKQFYKDLFNWYDNWAVHLVRFPTGVGKDAKVPKKPDVEKNRQHLIRLITRLIFVWFLRQKENLIPTWIFDEKEISKIIGNFDSKSEKQGNYYNGIIQNLFFATLNKPIKERKFANHDETGRKEDYGIKTKYRDFNDNSLFSNDYNPTNNPQKFIDLFNKIPFLNGGLFECLDNFDTKEYVDGFSREKERAAFVPNCLFWGDKDKTHEGLIPLLDRYNFTIEENTPQDIDISLDPELLGKVFENLLGTYNEETSSTARNESGSFYTPREIVDYMVDTSLKEYLKGKLDTKENDINEKLDKLFLYHELDHDFDNKQKALLMDAISDCKILDPACGSGAFPMGILNKLAFIMQKLDPKNEIWRTIQIKKVTEDTEKAKDIKDKEKRDKRLNEIKEVFDISTGEYSNYVRKLFLIENCIYGVDIQPIAIQISKLRFFISLITDQKTDGNIDNNYNVLPLPNLETKFVAANTLIGIKRGQGNLIDRDIEEKQEELLNIRHNHFSAREAKEKIDLRKKDSVLCRELAELLKKGCVFSSDEVDKLLDWNPYNQTKPADFFDPVWMFGLLNKNTSLNSAGQSDGFFDIVIGNPPYFVIKKDEKLKSNYEEIYHYLRSGRVNIYQLFMGCSTNLLSENGVMIFIHPKTLLSDVYLSATRNFLLSHFATFDIVNIISRKDTFGAVLQSVVVSLWNKNKKAHECHVSEISKKNEFINLSFLSLEKSEIVSPHMTLLVSGNPIIYKIEKKLRNIETMPLNFTTGSIEWNKYSSYLSGVKKTTSKRLIYGENIQRFYFAESRNRVNTSFLSNKAPNVPVLTKTAIFTQRTTAVEQPYRIIASIVNPKTFDIPIVSENGTNVYICDDIQIAFYILGILNSKLFDFYFRLFNSNTHVSSTELNRLPIIKPNKKQLDKINTIVEEICNIKKRNPDVATFAQEQELNITVYRLYKLDYDEVKAIEPKFTLSKVEYEKMF